MLKFDILPGSAHCSLQLRVCLLAARSSSSLFFFPDQVEKPWDYYMTLEWFQTSDFSWWSSKWIIFSSPCDEQEGLQNLPLGASEAAERLGNVKGSWGHKLPTVLQAGGRLFCTQDPGKEPFAATEQFNQWKQTRFWCHHFGNHRGRLPVPLTFAWLRPVCFCERFLFLTCETGMLIPLCNIVRKVRMVDAKQSV